MFFRKSTPSRNVLFSLQIEECAANIQHIVYIASQLKGQKTFCLAGGLFVILSSEDINSIAMDVLDLSRLTRL